MADVLAVAGLLCVLYAFISLLLEHWPRRYRERTPRATGRERVAALAVAVALLALAAAADLVDAKVGDARHRTPAPAASDYFASHLPAFEPGAVLRDDRLRNGLCLVRYYSSRPGKDPGANWWTTCQANSGFKTVADVRSKLALPKAWGPRNARVFARIPAGEEVVYMRGRAAKQCEPTGKTCYAGGGDQLLFRSGDFDRSWFVRYECETGGESAPIRFVPCAG